MSYPDAMITITSKDIDDSWLFLNDVTIRACLGKTLNELFDNQQRFLAAYNEWDKLKTELVTSKEIEYVDYMNFLESRNPNIINALAIKNISFDEKLKTVSDFIKSQATVYEQVFPFSVDEIVAWDENNFILRDSIYYSMSGVRSVFFLARLDIDTVKLNIKNIKKERTKL